MPMYDIDEAPAPKKKTTKRRSKSPQEDEATNSDFETLTFTNTQGEDKEWSESDIVHRDFEYAKVYVLVASYFPL